MPIDRRHLLSTTLAAGTLVSGAAVAAGPRKTEGQPTARAVPAQDLSLAPDPNIDQTHAFQAAVDQATERGVALALPPGRFLVNGIRLREGTRISGHPGKTILAMARPGTLITGDLAHGARLDGLSLDGNHALTGPVQSGLLQLQKSRNIRLTDIAIRGAQANGIALTACSGAVRDCTVSGAVLAGLLSLDAEGLEISHNHISDCANNGILVWRSAIGEDGTIVTNNRIERIKSAAGGTGQNGNGVNIYRAGNVLITGNRITDCAYTAIRGNAASNIQMVANNCQRLGEVALYAEFGFEGALIASNLVDGAGTGISVTNFNEGGRLAVIQGNLIRNLQRREHEPEDKRGEGIGVEADAVVTGNTIENAPTAGIVIGWGPYMREVLATSNVIRRSRVGIMITRDPGAGAAMIAQNLISGAREGAIRAMDKGVLVGPDLAKAPPQSPRIQISGNLAVDSAA